MSAISAHANTIPVPVPILAPLAVPAPFAVVPSVVLTAPIQLWARFWTTVPFRLLMLLLAPIRAPISFPELIQMPLPQAVVVAVQIWIPVPARSSAPISIQVPLPSASPAPLSSDPVPICTVPRRVDAGTLRTALALALCPTVVTVQGQLVLSLPHSKPQRG